MILSGRGLVNHAPQDFFYSDYFRIQAEYLVLDNYLS
ncbi:MAG: hypothetical protein JWQ79_2397 [Mucilaginibacter sp.]|nr:hypothetical protein [Mucilaginibacter sp.]